MINSIRHSALQGKYLFLNDYQYRYGMAYLGYFWAAVQPVMMALPYIFVGKNLNFADQDSINLSYEVYSLSGLFIWHVFWGAATAPLHFTRRARKYFQTISLRNSSMVFCSLYHNAIHLFFIFLVTAAACLVTKVSVAPTILYTLLALPFIYLFGITFGLALGTIGSIYQDIRYGIGFAGTILLWSAPILHEIPEKGALRILNIYNPFTYMIIVTRNWAFGIKNTQEDMTTFFAVTGITCLVSFFLYSFFKRKFRLAIEYVL